MEQELYCLCINFLCNSNLLPTPLNHFGNEVSKAKDLLHDSTPTPPPPPGSGKVSLSVSFSYG